jgi:hypothetical protein
VIITILMLSETNFDFKSKISRRIYENTILKSKNFAKSEPSADNAQAGRIFLRKCDRQLPRWHSTISLRRKCACGSPGNRPRNPGPQLEYHLRTAVTMDAPTAPRQGSMPFRHIQQLNRCKMVATAVILRQIFFRRIPALTWAPRNLGVTVGMNRRF